MIRWCNVFQAKELIKHVSHYGSHGIADGVCARLRRRISSAPWIV